VSSFVVDVRLHPTGGFVLCSGRLRTWSIRLHATGGFALYPGRLRTCRTASPYRWLRPMSRTGCSCRSCV